MDRPTVRLLRGQAHRLRQGHPWAYANEIALDEVVRAIPPGSLVRLVDAGDEALGCASFNPHSLIAARLIAADADASIDAGFLGDRLAAALALRERLFARPFYRLVHAEGDRLPGLVIDRFDDVAVVQPNTAGAERLLDPLLAALEAVIAPRAIVVRADAPVRRLEGLEPWSRVVSGTLAGPVPLEEDGVRFFADVMAGQKTGWYYDQRANRAFLCRLAAGARVLDLYGYSGAFALRLLAAGAAAARVVDRSELGLALGRRAAAENGLHDRADFVLADAFAEIARARDAGERYEIVVADPPSFVKSRKALKPGLRGYRKLARLAAAVVAPGGILFIASCSHNVSAGDFHVAVARGLVDAGREGQIVRAAGADADHPVHPGLPETAYLKSLVIRLR